jgi:thiol-disulfide isomerase/thioredoxin
MHNAVSIKNKIMKSIVLLLLIFTCIVSCNVVSMENSPEEITIAGRIVNYHSGSEKTNISIIINDNGLSDQINYSGKIDSVGYFNIKFTRYYPQDVMISYKTNFRVIVHPGDSLYVEFDGNTNQRTEIFETIKFGGKYEELNQKFAKYLKHYFETRPTSLERKDFKNLTLKEYKRTQDSIKSSRTKYASRFISEHNPSKELITWIWTDINFSHCDNLLNFPDWSKLQEYPDDWHSEYYFFINEIPTITNKELIYSDIRWFINQYHVSYVIKNLFNFGGTIKTSNIDSLSFNWIIDFVPDDGLLEQLVLSEFLNHYLKKYKFELYESNLITIEEKITEAFLIEPIMEHYRAIKEFLNKPIPIGSLATHDSKTSEAGEIWQEIIQQGLGKVMYIDCWGTWCGACLNEIPHAIKFHEKYRDSEIQFIYLCFRSEKEQWEKIISQYNLQGEQYLLTPAQESFFKELFDISGYPTYVIVDKDGNLVRKGSSFRPSNDETQRIIDKLL